MESGRTGKGFQITNPARGRKLIICLWVSGCYLVVSNHKPRKGTETNHFLHRISLRFSRFKSQTPQGDGNVTIKVVIRYANSSFKSQTPQGDGNFCRVGKFLVVRVVSNHKPRKGTETLNANFLSVFTMTRFKSQTPQGDGNQKNKEDSIFPERSFKSQTPQGDGNLYAFEDVMLDSKCFKSQTPQGDGNFSISAFVTSSLLEVSNHKPRKGTETRQP